MRPIDFWAMPIRQWWWLADDATPEKMYGSISESEMRELYEATYGEDRNINS